MNVALGRENLRQVSHLHRHSVRGWAPRTSRLRSATFLISVAIGAATLVLRLLDAASAPSDTDGARLLAGSAHFDVSRLSPAAAGSWLYVAAGHAVHVVTGLSAVHSLVLLAALGSAGAAALTCAAGTALAGRFVGLAAAALVASAPVSWFAGATVSAYGFDAMVSALLLVLARRARPYRAHGVAAVAVLGLGAGVRLSILPALALLAAVAVVASVRTLGQLLATVLVGAASLAVWFVPMVVIQPGHVSAWAHAVHVQISDAARASSVFTAPTSAVVTNIGRFGGWSLVSLAPVIVLAVLGILALAGARLVTRQPAGNAALRIWNAPAEPADRYERPRYQGTVFLLLIAALPPLALVTLDRFAGGGDVLWYLTPLVILLLLPVARLLHHRSPGVRRAALLLSCLLVAAAVGFNVQRFVSGPGILPAAVARHQPDLWLSRARYQAPYRDTLAAIRAADRNPPCRHRPASAPRTAADRSAEAGCPDLHP